MKKPCAGELLAAWAAQGAGATPEASLHLHLEACSGCAEEHRALLEMRDALAALPARRTPPARVDAIRFRITAAARRTAAVRGEAAPAAPPARGSFRLRTFALLAAALVTVFAVLVAWPRPRTPVASVELAEGARGHLAQPGADERYALLDGVARFHVRRLVQGESFRVSVGDDTVTVRGTVFEVTAEDGGIAAVEVSEGSVLLTLADGWSRHLEAGDSWRRARNPVTSSMPDAPAAPAETPEASATADTPPSGAPPVAQPVPATPAATPSRSASAALPAAAASATPGASSSTAPAITAAAAAFDSRFQLARAALHSGNAAAAATGFDALAASADVDAGRRADALYWAASAHAQAGHAREAEDRARSVASMPSWHADDAALLLGESLLRRGDPTAARPWLEQAARSPREAIRTRAARALATPVSDAGP